MHNAFSSITHSRFAYLLLIISSFHTRFFVTYYYFGFFWFMQRLYSIHSIRLMVVCVFFFHSKTRNQIANQYTLLNKATTVSLIFFLRALFYLLPKLSFDCIDSLVVIFLYSYNRFIAKYVYLYWCMSATINSIHFFFLVDVSFFVVAFS